MTLAGWGRFPRVDCNVVTSRDEADIRRLVGAGGSLIARGAGRAYGDAALNRDCTLLMTGHNRLLDFDPITGRLTCEAGVLLADIVSLFAPRGWFPPVTPGTKFVTVGGMIACDVHGKNHHNDGSFGDHVESLELMLATGEVVSVSASENAALFAATIGGMGLTGIILRATFRLRPVETPFVRQRTIRAPDLFAAIQILKAQSAHRYAVAWVDCIASGARLGRSVVYVGDHARAGEIAGGNRTPRRSLQMPIDLPRLALNRLTVGAHNMLRYAMTQEGEAIVDADRFFYPLDAILDWNRIYGRGGFIQHQSVLPAATSEAGLEALLTRIARAGSASFLAVLKQLGATGRGHLSFPRPGFTLALDFAVTPLNLALAADLDAIVAEHGGRCYLAKDARTTAAMITAGYPQIERFALQRSVVDPARRLRSALSDRLGL